MKIRISFSGRSYHQAQALGDELPLPDNATVNDALAEIEQRLDDQGLPSSCLVTVSGNHLGTVANHQNQQLSDGDELVLIAPVAGG